MAIYRTSPAVIAARRREVAWRYKEEAKQRHKRPLTFAAIRVAELTRLFDHRYGKILLPDSDTGVMCARVMLDHIARLKDAPRRISNWLNACAPWLSLASHERMLRDAMECPLRYSADRLAWKLRVTATERTELKLRTIGALGSTKTERHEQAKQRRRERDKQRRGGKPRTQYEAQSVSRAKPWAAIGMSRTAWYRAGKPQPPA